METYSYEDIDNHIMWGGFYEALDSFEPNEVPSEISLLWETARLTKQALEEEFKLIKKHFPEELQ